MLAVPCTYEIKTGDESRKQDTQANKGSPLLSEKVKVLSLYYTTITFITNITLTKNYTNGNVGLRKLDLSKNLVLIVRFTLSTGDDYVTGLCTLIVSVDTYLIDSQ